MTALDRESLFNMINYKHCMQFKKNKDTLMNSKT